MRHRIHQYLACYSFPRLCEHTHLYAFLCGLWRSSGSPLSGTSQISGSIRHVPSCIVPSHHARGCLIARGTLPYRARAVVRVVIPALGRSAVRLLRPQLAARRLCLRAWHRPQLRLCSQVRMPCLQPVPCWLGPRTQRRSALLQKNHGHAVNTGSTACITSSCRSHGGAACEAQHSTA